MRTTPDEARAQPMATSPPGAAARLGAGLAVIVIVFVLGGFAQTGGLARWGLSVDQTIAAHLRAPALTVMATVLTWSATPEVVGIAAAVVVPFVLLIVRRRSDALRALCVIGGSLALALVAKAVIAEPRPPSSLWAIPADSGASYPSGHTAAVAAVVVALMVVARTRRWRYIALIVGGLYVLAVAASRVYVADHYPLDVVGSLLAATAAGFIVAGLAGLAPVHSRLAQLDAGRRGPEGGDPGRALDP